MKVSIDREACIGAGTCVVVAPEYFELDDEGLAVAIQTEVKAGDEGLVRDAEQGCPAQAIILEE